MVTALVTGFEPFGRWSVNSSGEAARLLAERRGDVAVRVLPVDHDAAPAALAAALAETRPGALLMTGLADGTRPRLELRARRPDHLAEGPAERRGLWPWARARDALRAAGTAAALSTDAGRYVCETTYWAGLGALGAGGPRLAAFLHVPPLSEEWPVARVADAVAACLDAGRAAAGISAA